MQTYANTTKIGLKAALLLSIALLPSSTGAQPNATTPRPLSLDEAIAVAIRNSKPLQAAAQRVSLQQGVVAERRAGYNPTLGTRFTVTQLDEADTASFNGQSVTLSKQTQKEVALSASLPIDIAGQIAAAVSQAQWDVLSARLEYSTTRNDLVTQVKADYYTVLRRQALVEVAQSDLKNAQERLRISESKFKAGVIAQFDVLRAQTDVAAAQEALIRTRNDVALSYAQLHRILGADPLMGFTTQQVAFEQPALGEPTALQKEAQTNRPELLRAQADIRAAEKGIKLARRNTDPDLSVSFGYAYMPDAGGFAPRTNAWQANATLRFPLFDGGVSKARVHQARQGVELARTGLKDTQEQVALEAKQASLNVVTAQERIPVAEAGLAQAQESYRLAEVRFRSGVSATPGNSPLLELNDAQTALTRAQTDLVNAQYDLLNARAALDRALGHFAYGPEKPGVTGPGAVKH